LAGVINTGTLALDMFLYACAFAIVQCLQLLASVFSQSMQLLPYRVCHCRSWLVFARSLVA
jgi:hypothetical protein